MTDADARDDLCRLLDLWPGAPWDRIVSRVEAIVDLFDEMDLPLAAVEGGAVATVTAAREDEAPPPVVH